MQRPRPLSPKNLFALTILLFSLIAGLSLIDTHELAELDQDITTAQEEHPYSSAANPPAIEADWQHILYGDESGGGHLYGVGRPCKSEFPADWTPARIRQTVTLMAANDNAQWRQEENGYLVSEQRTDDLNIRIVLDPEKAEVVTSYPLNVQRNPCPRPANDG